MYLTSNCISKMLCFTHSHNPFYSAHTLTTSQRRRKPLRTPASYSRTAPRASSSPPASSAARSDRRRVLRHAHRVAVRVHHALRRVAAVHPLRGRTVLLLRRGAVAALRRGAVLLRRGVAARRPLLLLASGEGRRQVLLRLAHHLLLQTPDTRSDTGQTQEAKSGHSARRTWLAISSARCRVSSPSPACRPPPLPLPLPRPRPRPRPPPRPPPCASAGGPALLGIVPS